MSNYESQQMANTATAFIFAPDGVTIYVLYTTRIKKLVNNTASPFVGSFLIDSVISNPTSTYIDGTGTDAAFASIPGPAFAAVTAGGDILVPEGGVNNAQAGNRVQYALRRVTAGGVVSTIVKGGTCDGCTVSLGYADGSTSTARFAAVKGVAVDASGNMYVSDGQNIGQFNRVVRKITLSGMVSTYAGVVGGGDWAVDGPASSAVFVSPGALVVDSVGNVYVTDASSIRKIWVNGTVSTHAGNDPNSQSNCADSTPSAPKGHFATMGSLVLHSSGTLFVISCNSVHSVSPNGWVTTVFDSAGTPLSLSIQGNTLVIFTSSGIVSADVLTGNTQAFQQSC